MQRTWQRFAAIAAAAFLLGVAAAGYAAAAAHPEWSMKRFGTRVLFLEKCSRCHAPERAYGQIGDQMAWMRTVAVMALKDREWMPPEAVRAILDYQAYYPAHRRLIFQHRCGGCHEPEELQRRDRSGAQWRTVITYMARRQGFDMTVEERELLITGLH